MPNWCGNTLTITHEDPAMIIRAKEAFAEGRFLDEFIPVPEELKIVAGCVGDPDEQAKLELQETANREKFGYTNWYDYCVNEWGTKWDVGNGNGIQTWDDHELIVYFDSAWAPPIAAYEHLQDLGFTVYATYYEPGCAFAGIYDECGDSYYDLSGMDSGDVQQQLPQELDESFGISESMAEYEAENEDEVTTWYKEGVEECELTPHKIKKDETND
jgi:hypothetical protein